jgi:hypothetical protein
MRWPLSTLLALALLPHSMALAQTAQPALVAQPAPTIAHSGGPPGTYSASEYHAVPPLPYRLVSPMQSLPPPQALGAEKPLPPIAGRVIERPGYDALIHDDGRLLMDTRFLRTGLGSDPGGRSSGPWATFDLTDLLSPQDPYRGDKLSLLHETFAQRAHLREKHNELVMDRALAALPRYLDEIWHNENWDLATRRHVLFALWDECIEQGSELEQQGGAAARRQIEDYIRAVLPPGSRGAFRDEEITAFNQTRTSLATFAPGGY